MVNKIAVFLDDERHIDFIKDKVDIDNYKWIVIRNYFDFMDYIDDNLDKIKLVSFDHDIDSFDEGGLEWTGKDAALYLQRICQEKGISHPDFLVHSMNNVGKQNIISYVKNYINKFEGRGDWTKFKYYHVGWIDGKFV